MRLKDFLMLEANSTILSSEETLALDKLRDKLKTYLKNHPGDNGDLAGEWYDKNIRAIKKISDTLRYDPQLGFNYLVSGEADSNTLNKKLLTLESAESLIEAHEPLSSTNEISGHQDAIILFLDVKSGISGLNLLKTRIREAAGKTGCEVVDIDKEHAIVIARDHESKTALTKFKKLI